MEKTDPKATIVAAFRFYRNHGSQSEEFKFTVLAFYDDEKPSRDEDNPFNDFLSIKPHGGKLENSHYTTLQNVTSSVYDHVTTDVVIENLSLLRENDFKFRAASFPSSEIAGMGVTNGRARWGNVMVSKYTENLINVIEAQAKMAKELMQKNKGRMVVVDIWPFLPTMFDNSSDSAWPHEINAPNGPLLVYFMWEGKENDKVWIDQLKMALNIISLVAFKEKCITPDAAVYLNTALDDSDMPVLEKIYQNNLTDLCALRTKYDPGNVMGMTGGFRIPLGPAIVSGSYTIMNDDKPIAVIGPPGPVLFVNSLVPFIFKISSAQSESGLRVYKIYVTGACESYYARDSHGEIRCELHESSSDTWDIRPESRKNNQLEYSIVNGAGDKHWVLDEDGKVKCVAIGEKKDKALWRFNRNYRPA